MVIIPVIKNSSFMGILFLPGWMTVITGSTDVLVSGYPLVFISQIDGIVVFMTENTLKSQVIIRIHMAISTDCPFTLVPSRIDGEVKNIMIPGGLVPVGRVMAIFTLLGKTGS
jgi:hypothetical protein